MDGFFDPPVQLSLLISQPGGVGKPFGGLPVRDVGPQSSNRLADVDWASHRGGGGNNRFAYLNRYQGLINRPIYTTGYRGDGPHSRECRA
jgi:hypothetical protein